MLRIGIDLGGTKIEGVLLDDSREVARLRVATPRGDYAGTLDAIAGIVNALEPSSGGARATVGVGIPGVVAPDTGLVKNANSVWLMGRPFAADLEARLDRRVRVANDANCFAVSEAADGAAADAAVVFGVIVGTGTGAGIVVNGQVLTGPNAIAGEWGHNPLPWPEDDERPGPLCYCGGYACVETFLSGPGLARDHEQWTGSAMPAEAIVAAAARGDAGAEASMRRYESRMARALAAIINVLDPDAIVLGGGMSNVDRLYANVPALWGRWIFGATRTGSATAAAGSARIFSRLVRAAHGDSSGVRGAAWLWPRP